MNQVEPDSHPVCCLSQLASCRVPTLTVFSFLGNLTDFQDDTQQESKLSMLWRSIVVQLWVFFILLDFLVPLCSSAACVLVLITAQFLSLNVAQSQATPCLNWSQLMSSLRAQTNTRIISWSKPPGSREAFRWTCSPNIKAVRILCVAVRVCVCIAMALSPPTARRWLPHGPCCITTTSFHSVALTWRASSNQRSLTSFYAELTLKAASYEGRLWYVWSHMWCNL